MSCSDVWQQACGVPAGVDPSDGMSETECAQVCGTRPNVPYWGCAPYLLDDLPGPSFECYTCVEGRRPHGYVGPRAAATTIGGWLANAADLERVSVDAFQILRRELAAHGAPADLEARAAAAEADEVRHTRILSAFARSEGAAVTGRPVAHGEVRTLLEIALENAVEGCVRETYGALVAGYQAEHATRKEIRRAMKRIYADETAHAELAWDVHTWILARMGSEQRRMVEDAMEQAIRELAVAARAPIAPALQGALGLPPAEAAVALVSGLVVNLILPNLAA